MTTWQPAARDPGLQPERTALAWRRLAVAFLGFSLAALKLTAPVLHAWAVLPALLFVGGALSLLIALRRRYLSVLAATTSSGAGRLPDGRLPLLATVLCLSTAVASLLFLAFGIRP